MTQPQYKIPQWFCVHTKPLRENEAVLSLSRLTAQVRQNVGDVEVYFPRMKTKMSVGGHSRLVLRPLFPRYFFARFIWEKAVRFVASRPQVINLVHFGKLPTIVPASVIEDLKQWSIHGDAEVFDPTAQLKAGQRVLIKSGPFKGLEAEFVAHLNDGKRVMLLLDHLQSQARLTLDRTNLKAV